MLDQLSATCISLRKQRARLTGAPASGLDQVQPPTVVRPSRRRLLRRRAGAGCGGGLRARRSSSRPDGAAEVRHRAVVPRHAALRRLASRHGLGHERRPRLQMSGAVPGFPPEVVLVAPRDRAVPSVILPTVQPCSRLLVACKGRVPIPQNYSHSHPHKRRTASILLFRGASPSCCTSANMKRTIGIETRLVSVCAPSRSRRCPKMRRSQGARRRPKTPMTPEDAKKPEGASSRRRVFRGLQTSSSAFRHLQASSDVFV